MKTSASNMFTMSRRKALSMGAAGLIAAVGLAGCGRGGSSQPAGSAAGAGSEKDSTVAINAAAYDKLIASGAVADAASIEANAWAKRIHDAGKIRLGEVHTSTLFSLLDEKDGKLRGFDAGISQLLTRYILGDESKHEGTQVTSDTRESVLQNDQVDAVFATYSITDDRKKVISFAGPYYETQQAILVLKDENGISGVDDLAGKKVAVQSGSTGPALMEKLVPEAKLQEFKTDEEARSALMQKRVDAYVIDRNMHLGSMIKQPGKYKLVGEAFGPVDPYGIGLPLNSDGVTFVNDFLRKIEEDGTWEELWKICIGERADVHEVPVPPAIGA
ncbi:glutamate ABC transporter substrate-binding protein [Collinsella sp. AGMB00827]|uniref:Glutamate ABC transporter substrate-binding protein n=1 Tax=Collinsella ureilytica TaxID=2869515 RepID=A0ABS7MIF4_9ACTN|nr:glutamate ABC transporter substrate-binding protein [Collinsella urealyticum]MBY4797148.1 glutamate ABC transporter substrate-binding protein [Collinsella urealyticum]